MTPSSLVEVYDVDLPPSAPDNEVLAATASLAPITSTRQATGEPFVSWRDYPDLDEAIDEFTAVRKAFERATEQMKAAVETPAGAAISDRELARRIGVDRITIRRWRGPRTSD